MIQGYREELEQLRNERARSANPPMNELSRISDTKQFKSTQKSIFKKSQIQQPAEGDIPDRPPKVAAAIEPYQHNAESKFAYLREMAQKRGTSQVELVSSNQVVMDPPSKLAYQMGTCFDHVKKHVKEMRQIGY